jgi:hypothetical protein
MNKRTYVGLDVHARSVKGCAIDRETGEILRQSLAANDAGTVETSRNSGKSRKAEAGASTAGPKP